MSKIPLMRDQPDTRIVLTLTLATAGLHGVVPVAAVAGTPALPQPCSAAAVCAGGPSKFVTAGNATLTSGGPALTINQTSNSAILNWGSFNVGPGGSVTFRQPGASAIALNRIFQASPSQIFGNLAANGQVYLINLNGFVFGKGATVNVGGLLASSLPLTLTDATFANGILSPLQSEGQQRATFDASLDPLAPGTGRQFVLDANGSAVLDANGNTQPVRIVVQSGAQLTAADQGRLLLAGQNVTNGGALVAPDGQVILAAGAKIYLQADTDPGLRGLVVEVDQGGTAWNQLTGSLSAPRGDVSMVGFMVNQDGRVSATTAVSANGSIHLEAADTATFAGTLGAQTVASTHGGTLTLGPQSQLSILPDTSTAATATSATTQLPSSVTLLGEKVYLQGGSIIAPGGDLTALATANPASADAPRSPSDPRISGIASGTDPNASLRVDPGTLIDLSGSVASLPVSANLVPAQLRSSELANDPNQRNGALHGATVYINARLGGSTPIADFTGDIAAVPQNIEQRTETGGTAILQSSGDLAFASGASINVSGGWTNYAGGVLQTSYLIGTDGALYPIATANPLLTYVGVFNPTFSQTYNSWGVKDILPTPGLSSYQPAYVQGAAGGNVQFAAPSMVLAGTLLGSAVNGAYQRTPSSSVAGGTLTIGIPGGAGISATTPPADYIASNLMLTATQVPSAPADTAPLPASTATLVPLEYLTGSGFTSAQLYSNGDVTLPANTPVALPAGSSLLIDAARIDVLSGIRDPGGAITLQNEYTAGVSGTSAARGGVFIGDGVTLDVRGQWTNDLSLVAQGLSPLAQTWQNGGKIELDVTGPGALLSIGANDALRASGGAWLQGNGSLVAGTGGAVALNANAVNDGLDVGSNLAIDGFGVNGAAGGTFSLSAPRLNVGSATAHWTTAQQVDDASLPGGVFTVGANLFSDYGFQTFNLNAAGAVVAGADTANLLTVAPGVKVEAVVATHTLSPAATLQPSAQTLDGLTTTTTLPAYLRSAASVSLSALQPTSGPNPASNTASNGGTSAGDLSIGQGASITTDAGGSITLTGLDSIIVDGTLRAPGGKVQLQIQTPSETFDVGFLPTQRLELGASAVIDVSGTFVPQPSTLGLQPGTLFAGGQVSLLADRGGVLTDPGSLIDVAGAGASLDAVQPNGTYVHEAAASAGGSVTVHSGEAIALLGEIAAAAGPTGTTGQAAAGLLDVALTRSENWWGVSSPALLATFNAAPLVIDVVPTRVGTGAPGAASNLAVLGTDQLAAAGIDGLRLEAGGAVQFTGDARSSVVTVALGRQFVIDSPAVSTLTGTTASVSAPYVQIGYDVSPYLNAQAAVPGTGTLNFAGNEIDLVGTTVVQGASTVSLQAAGDLVLRGEPTGLSPSTLQGSFTVAGELNLAAGRIYPVTATSFTLAAQEAAPGTASAVTIHQSGANPGTPLSAGGALSITADDIVSAGTLYAPFGTISLNAAAALDLADGSLTSVSGAGLVIPYGQTEFQGLDWIYQPPGGGTQLVTTVPSRSVSLTGPAITLAAQATVDVRGGGDLQAYEWLPGAGGTQDKLTSDPAVAGYTPGLYAILPGTVGHASPQDPQNSTGTAILPGATVYLSGGGIAPGFYPLLPANYALVPGAVLIQLEPKFSSATPGMLGTLQDGTPIVAGYLSYGTTGLRQTPGFQGFAVYPGSYGNQLAQYNLSLASAYFSAAATKAGAPRPVLPADAGTFGVDVTSPVTAGGAGNPLVLLGQVRTAAGSGGQSASVQISATDLVVGTPDVSTPAGAVSVSDTVIEGWQPGSLLLGGTQLAGSDAVQVAANSVTLAAGSSLSADQVVLVANSSIDVQSGASLRATSAVTGTAPAALPATQDIALSGASGATPALLAVSDLQWLIPLRAAGSPAPGAASLVVGSGATVASRGSLSIDGPGGVALHSTPVGAGAEWSLGSSSIAFVPAGVTADALSIDPALLAQLGTASALRLASTGALDLYTPVSLGVTSRDGVSVPGLSRLLLNAESLNNLTAPGGAAGATTSEFGAQTVILGGPGPTSVAPSVGPAGAALQLDAGRLEVGPGSLSVNGFASTLAQVSGAVIGEGAGALTVGGDLVLSAQAVTVSAAAQTDLAASGRLAVQPSAATATTSPPALLGGQLALHAGSIDISGTVTAPAGVLTLNSGGDVTLESGALLSSAGSSVVIQNRTVATAGGSIAVVAGGALTLAPGATLDASAASGAAGGVIALTAGGAATLGSTLRGGSFALDAGSLAAVASQPAAETPLDVLATTLGTGGFSQAITVQVRSGELALDAGQTLSAQTVTLTADAGQVIVAGDVTANSGALRGSLSLFGGGGVTVTGSLHADGGAGFGGMINIGAGRLAADQNGLLDQFTGGDIQLGGATLSTAGQAGDGSVMLRAPATQSSGDVVIGSLASTRFSGVTQVVVEPVLAFNTADTTVFSNATAPSARDWQNVQQAVGAYMSLAGSVAGSRLAPNGGLPLLIDPGVEVVASDPTATLTLGAASAKLPALDLSQSGWRFNGAPVDLTVLSAGNLLVANSVTDGIKTVNVGGTSQPTLLSGPSASISLVAGADLTSANPLGAIAGSTGSLTLGVAGSRVAAQVATGTGNLNLVAAEDIVIGNPGSGAYTAGIPAVAAGGSTTTPYINVPADAGSALASGIQIPKTGLLMSFPADGGSLTVQAGRDILGAALTTPSATAWQLREGGGTSADVQPAWGVNLAAYKWNFGTLGGGDLRLAAGRDALNVTAAAADSRLPPYGGAAQLITSGGLSFTAGRDIGSAEVYLADGSGLVHASGALTAILPSLVTGDVSVGSGFYLQASSLTVSARLGIAADGVFNPTGEPQFAASNPKALTGAYLSFSNASSLSLQSIDGDITLGAASGSAQALLGTAQTNAQGSNVANGVFPASLAVEALGGNLILGPGLGGSGSATLYPSPQGQLELLAARDIAGGGGSLSLSDAPAGSYATVATPSSKGSPVGVAAAFAGDLHGADPTPALVTAGNDITQLTLSVPKAAEIVAGRDIVDLNYAGQNLQVTDVTLIQAGRDFNFSANSNGAVAVGGPGALDLLAGRDVSLGFSIGGVTTEGNLRNANLSTAQGADLTIATGLGTTPDFSGFYDRVVRPSTAYQQALVNYIESLQGASGLSYPAAYSTFSALTPADQRPFLDQVFYHELALSGIADNAVANAGFRQGYAAIDALYPGSRTASAGALSGSFAGNLTLDFSRIYTLSGGNITLDVPGGSVDVGLANPPATLAQRSASSLGIVTEGSGNIDIYAKGDVNVNSSRIFTLGGGNILIWSDEGSIDAGRGAKTAISAPPPSILINSDGTVTINFSGAAAGSGIRTIQTGPTTAAGSVDLIAPEGTVNAGDAGIGSAGNINIAARTVVGLDNIQFGGSATGVPAAVGGIGASLAGATSAAGGASNAATNSVAGANTQKDASAALAASSLSWLDVYVTGLGEDNCRPDDVECLKRQKSPTR